MVELNLEMQPVVLLYNMQSGERADLVREYLTATGVQIVDVYPADFLQPVGALAGVPGVTREAGPYLGIGFEDEMLIMYRFDDMRMNAFFAFFRRKGIPTVDLKAIVTPTNAFWNSVDLHRELAREHAALQKRKG